MATTGHNTSFIRKQGGTDAVLASGGTLTVESGGTINVDSGGAFTIDSGGSITMPVSTRTTTNVATAIPSYGFASLVASTTTPDYTLGAPAAGKVVYLRVESNTSSGTCTVTTTAAFDAGGSKNKLLLNAADDAVTLVGISSTGWAICSNVGSVATTSG